MIFMTNKRISRIIEFISAASFAYDCANKEQKDRLLDSFDIEEIKMLNHFYTIRNKLKKTLTRKI